jgi:hypothetical protein
MRTIALALAVAGLIATGGIADAQSLSSFASSPVSNVPRAGLFIGLGGRYNSVNFSDHNVFAQGVSNVYQNGVLVAFGSAGGPADPYFDTHFTISPAAQVGYFQHFADSRWLWGAKFS